MHIATSLQSQLHPNPQRSPPSPKHLLTLAEEGGHWGPQGIVTGKQQSILLLMVTVKGTHLADTWPWRAECRARSPSRGAGCWVRAVEGWRSRTSSELGSLRSSHMSPWLTQPLDIGRKGQVGRPVLARDAATTGEDQDKGGMGRMTFPLLLLPPGCPSLEVPIVAIPAPAYSGKFQVFFLRFYLFIYS